MSTLKQAIGTGEMNHPVEKLQPTFENHFEASAFVAEDPNIVFAYADDPAQLSSHMSESSWMMGCGQMKTDVDEGRGQNIGSHFRLTGRVFGLELSVDEVVIERLPPQRKVWQTIGSPRLLVIGHYRMGFDIDSHESGSLLRVFIDYALPENRFAHWLGVLLARYYARWCTERMVDDVTEYFASAP